MKHVDEVRGFHRTILMGDGPGHTVSGGNAVSGCAVEAVECDPQARSPVLSLRFYHKPFYSHKQATESAERGHPLYDAETPIGVEINLGLELAHSLMEQINSHWPEFIQQLKEYAEDDGDVESV